MSRRWFTNSRHPKADAADWMRFSVGSVVAIGEPQATRECDVSTLRRLKMHGLYEALAGVPALPRAEDCPGYLEPTS
jgi:hypothetical protein